MKSPLEKNERSCYYLRMSSPTHPRKTRARREQAAADDAARKGRVPRPRGLRTRRAILRKAVNIASIEGLEGLTIGKLAAELGISKSGLFAHFGSKEDLQCAVVEQAREIFVEKVVRPAYQFQGLKRLRALCENWLAYGEEAVFPGGCFFSAASLEFDDRPGRVREQIVGLMKKWLGNLEQAARDAQAAGEIAREADVRQLAFEIQALAMGANWSSRLFQDPGIFRSVRRAIVERIEKAREATPSRC
ncbi:MAG TPA: TetR/AcrR family transcriptional regulator [Candidatus Acidoferrum sp.]|nr:TetR/AcrR family transcriptional regulator [Candidatus Acidoferrum sp.]